MKPSKPRAIFATWIATIFALALIVITACSPSEPTAGEGFAIYLPAQDIKASQVTDVNALQPAREPLVSIDDIVSYAESTHEIVLTPQAYNRLADELGVAKVPTSGKVFIVCVDRQPVYWGAFWPIYSSQSFNGIIITTPLMVNSNTIQITQGYPSASFFRGTDLRSDPTILQSLCQAGKLK